jgi:hypothetical protein
MLLTVMPGFLVVRLVFLWQRAASRRDSSKRNRKDSYPVAGYPWARRAT